MSLIGELNIVMMMSLRQESSREVQDECKLKGMVVYNN